MTPRRSEDELVFAPLGGVGEIGMNLSLYGYRTKRARSWIAVDFGVSFAGEDLPGVDVILPDISFLIAERKNLGAIFLTHAHEDHFGALIDLWPRLRVPVYATPFAAALLEAKRLAEPNAPEIAVTVVQTGARIVVGPFDVEYVAVAHSIPEAHALIIRTKVGAVLHTGDWKLDPTPVIGPPTDEARLKALGEEGCLALIGDSTNAVRDGRSPSERDVSRTLAELIASARARVAVTTFASNVARIHAVAAAARACGREVIVVGRAMQRMVQVARETGHLDGVQEFHDAEMFHSLPAHAIVALCTGSQGEPRAALARIAQDKHPDVALARGDRVILSCRTIPGNEKAVARIVNGLVGQGIEVVSDRTHLVHVSGHPRRAEMRELYQWVRPRIAIPVHGEALHLAEHAALARGEGVGEVVLCGNGDVVRLAAGASGIVDEVPAGRWYKDGRLLLDAKASTVGERRRLAVGGIISAAIVLDEKGSLAGEIEMAMMGIPEQNAAGEVIDALVRRTIAVTLNHLPRARRHDPDTVAEALRRAVRAAVAAEWGKKPVCIVHVSTC
ncbi:MAG: ribonuclease J [Proteobacteria bacterium]|nr:ribonuclease J [Pseudomonadota bacterium]